LIGRELVSEDTEALSAGTCESILLVATTMACVDDDYSQVEREAVDRLRRRLGVPRNRAAVLGEWAKEFVVDQRFDEFYADGILDDAERARVEHLAVGLGMTAAAMARIEARARQRRGL
jgi:hypothetical protein